MFKQDTLKQNMTCLAAQGFPRDRSILYYSMFCASFASFWIFAHVHFIHFLPPISALFAQFPYWNVGLYSNVESLYSLILSVGFSNHTFVHLQQTSRSLEV